MDHPVLPGLFVVPVEPLPEVPRHQIARVCRRAGLVKAGERRETLQHRLLRTYAERSHGNTDASRGLTDAEVKDLMGVERSTVNARRAELMKLGLVEAKNIRPNLKSHVFNTVWGLTEKGRQLTGGHEGE